MPFGKYKDQSLDEIPVDYLVWVEENLYLKDDLREEINAEIKYRGTDQNRSSKGRDTGRRFR